MAKIKPISPDDVEEVKMSTIPDAVFEVFNQLIVENIRQGQAVINQDDVLTHLASRGVDAREAFNKGWLDIESIYRKEGWIVNYEKPGYNEQGSAYFTFEKPKKR